MLANPHAATRRELLIASGTLFAWAYLPKLARAEGRDPRLLVIVLRGALDGLAAVAPVGDPDWVKLRGDKALLRVFLLAGNPGVEVANAHGLLFRIELHKLRANVAQKRKRLGPRAH